MSEEEMTTLLSRVLGIPEGRARDWFQKADGNRDGVVHTHEFIQWLTTNPPMWKESVAVAADGKKTVEVNFVNTSGAVSQVFTVQFVNCENVSFPKGNPAEVVVQPGETKTMTLLHLTEPYKYRSRVSYRSDASSIEDDPNVSKSLNVHHSMHRFAPFSTFFHPLQLRPGMSARTLDDSFLCCNLAFDCP